jgi:predicted amidophosphoribosyltransferase
MIRKETYTNDRKIVRPTTPNLDTLLCKACHKNLSLIANCPQCSTTGIKYTKGENKINAQNFEQMDTPLFSYR